MFCLQDIILIRSSLFLKYLFMDQLEIKKHTSNQETNWLRNQEIFDVLNDYKEKENKRNQKNQKTNRRRNQLRKENWKKLKRWSKWDERNHFVGTNIYLDSLFELKNRLNDKLENLLKNGNIIWLFKLYWVDLKESWKLYRGLCPFHREETPSFTISKNKLVAKCFGCGKWSSLLKMLLEIKFWIDISQKRWRIELLEKDIDMFLDLEPIARF